MLGATSNRTPGISMPEATTTQNAFWWGTRGVDFDYVPMSIKSTVTDTGNTANTSILRPGFLLGKKTSDGLLYKWDPAATDGTQTIFGILYGGQNMLNSAGTAVDRFTSDVVVWGKVRASRLLIPGNSTWSIIGDAYEYVVRTQMASRFALDDQHMVTPTLFNNTGIWIAKTADYTVTAADHQNRFSTLGASGAVIFTLPTTATAGLRYEFCAMADQTMTITSGTADSIITDGDLAADSVAYSTASHKIGGRCIVEGLGGASTGKWLLTNIAVGCTGTVAT
jgi:hypothetical protein